MQSFSYQTHAVRILFHQPIIQAVTSQIPDPIRLGVIASMRYELLVGELAALKSVNSCHHFSKVTQHVPQSLVDEAVEYYQQNPVDVLLCIGGGSAVGLGKGVLVHIDTQLWAAPTTYSGSELTNIYGISVDGVKVVKRDDRVHPRVVIYDPQLSINLPLDVALPSAFNALAHLVEAVYSQESNPVTEAMTSMGISSILRALKQLNKGEKLSEAIHTDLLFGAYVGGKVLCEVSMGLHHKAAHVLGGNFNLEHAHIHTLLLPYVLEYQWAYLTPKQKSVYQDLFQSEKPYEALRQLQEKLGYGFSLRGLGFAAEDIPKAVSFLMDMSYPNPAPLDQQRLTSMLETAFSPTKKGY